MRKPILLLTTFAFILAGGALAARAQQEPMVTPQQPQVLQQGEQGRQLQGTQAPRRLVENDADDEGWTMGSDYGVVGSSPGLGSRHG
jgi:hypothetical protein